jgi:hypothetical protein
MAARLFKAAPEPKKFVKLKGEHATCYDDSKEQYLKAITDFKKNIKGDKR